MDAERALDLYHFAERVARLALGSTKMVGREGMKIHFYGRLADSIGRDIEIELPESISVADLRELLANEHPRAAKALGHRARACVGDAIVPDSHIVRPSDSVEFFPPVSGG